MVAESGIQFFGGGELESFDWDTLILGGEVWPGICEITGSGVKRRVDAKTTKGSDGARLKDEGMDLAKLNIKLLIYNRTDWADLQRLLPLVHPRRKGGPREPIAILTPYTQLLGIDSIYIKGIPIPSLDKSTQMLTLTMEAIEWVPQPRTVKKGAGKTNKVESTIEETIIAAAEGLGPDNGPVWGADAGPGTSPSGQAEAGLQGGLVDAITDQVNTVINNTFPDA
jgi:hypothetical protein